MRIWILVGDASGARLFESEGIGENWTHLEAFHHPASRAKARDLVTDSQSGQAERGESLKDHETERFAIELSHRLDVGLQASHFRRLVLVGPPKFVSVVKSKLSTGVANQLTDIVHKDYVHLSDREVETRVHEQLMLI